MPVRASSHPDSANNSTPARVHEEHIRVMQPRFQGDDQTLALLVGICWLGNNSIGMPDSCSKSLTSATHASNSEGPPPTKKLPCFLYGCCNRTK